METTICPDQDARCLAIRPSGLVTNVGTRLKTSGFIGALNTAPIILGNQSQGFLNQVPALSHSAAARKENRALDEMREDWKAQRSLGAAFGFLAALAV